MANKAIPFLIAGGAALLLLPKKKKKTTRKTAPNETTEDDSVIEFDDECGWTIPESWWGKVGGPKLKAMLDTGLAAAPTWEEKKEILKTPAFNSHKMAYDILSGSVPESCPLPPPEVDIMGDFSNATKQEENMINLFGHIINHVEATMLHFVQTNGEEILFPVPLDG